MEVKRNKMSKAGKPPQGRPAKSLHGIAVTHPHSPKENK